MKRLILVVLALAVALPGCGVLRGTHVKVEAGLGAGGQPITVARVKVFMRPCQAEAMRPCEDRAHDWLREKDVSHADAEELIARAEEDLAKERARCLGLENCGS